MAVHDAEVSVTSSRMLFADRDLTRPVANYRFPEQGRCPGCVPAVSDELILDGNSGTRCHVLPDVGGTRGSGPDGPLAGMAAKWRWRAGRRAEGNTGGAGRDGVKPGPGGLAQVRPLDT